MKVASMVFTSQDCLKNSFKSYLAQNQKVISNFIA